MIERTQAARFLSKLACFVAGGVFAFGCGDDEPSDAERIAAACQDACGGVSAGCGLEGAEASCQAACEVAGTVSSGCAREFEGYLGCAGNGAPLVTCDDDSVTVTASVSVCVEPLVSYLACAATAATPACLDAPAENAECVAQGLGSRATVCAGEPAGCTLFEGSLRAEGAGLFCCP